MSEFNAPRRGSMAFYPRVRTKKETPTIHAHGTEPGPLNFLCYKAGMIQIAGKNVHKASPTFNQEVVLPATVLECPPLKIFGVRAYEKDEIGENVLSDVIAENVDKFLSEKITNFKKPSQKPKKESKQATKDDSYTLDDFQKEMADITRFTLLVETQAAKIGFKKKPDLTEIWLGGTKEQQFAYAKEKLGKEVSIEEVFKEGQFLDVKGVTKGHGFRGPVKRFNIRSLRPKNKRMNVVGSIGPWHPHTVMFTVGRPGQMGYQSRTEFNKRLMKISDDLVAINPKSGFANYGNIKNKYAIIVGSLPGPAKRCLALRKSTRPEQKVGALLDTVKTIIKN
ncbi:MAG: 50S ribosomal protein L3 [archaeon]